MAYERDISHRAREVLDQLEREDRVGIVLLARPYHHDPGLNHELLHEQELADLAARQAEAGLALSGKMLPLATETETRSTVNA